LVSGGKPESVKVHVTGGVGFIGSALVRALAEQGHTVTVFDNVSRGEVSNLSDIFDEIRFVEGDVTNRDEFEAAVDDPDVLYHLAAINGTKNFYERPVDVLDTNLLGVKHAAEIVADQQIPRLVFASSSEVYGFPTEFPTPEDHALQIMDPTNPRFSYAGTKILGEQYVINSAEVNSYEYTVLRPHNVYGPKMGYDHVIPEFVEQIVTEKPFTIYGDGQQTRSFCYIDDAVRTFLRAGLTEPGANQIFNVGTEHEVTIESLAERLFEIAGEEPDVEYVDSVELDGSTRRRQPDVSRARSLLEYEPSVSLDEGLERTFAWYCEDFTGMSPAEWRKTT
jgi:nucleoside-diphosphate-sugar epimerase